MESGLERLAKAGNKPDRMESESIEFHKRVAAAYERLAAAEPNRFARLDATGSREHIHQTVMDRLRTHLESVTQPQ